MAKKALYILIPFISLIIGVSNTNGENIPLLKEVKLVALVQFDLNTGVYTYNYEIFNSLDSTGDISRFEVDISKPINGISLKKEGLVNGKGYLKNTSEDIWVTHGHEIIPVGFQSLPSGWMSGPTVRKTADWGAGEESVLIKHGQSLNGFVLTSYGLPVIREFKADPWIDINEFYPNVDELESMEEVDALMAKIKQDKENAVSKGKTIGPTAPPADFKPVDFLNNIINMKHEAYKLGWIKNEGILKSLDAKLDNAKKDIEKESTRSAKNTLKAFINEVEAQGCESYENCPSGKHLTSEAYGLLKYNAQYLIDHL